MSELSPAGFDRSLRLKVTRVGGSPGPHPRPPQPLGTPGREEERRLCCDVGEKNGQQGQRPKKAIQAAACPELPSQAPPATHTHGDSFPSRLCQPAPINSRAQACKPSPAACPGLFLGPQATHRTRTSPRGWRAQLYPHSNPGAEQEVSGELMLASFPVHPRSCHPCRGANQKTRSPPFTASDGLAGAGTTRPKMHSSISTHKHTPLPPSVIYQK